MTRRSKKSTKNGPLTAAQTQVLSQLVSGETVTSSARAGGVSRETVHRWLREDFRFKSELNRALMELQCGVEARLQNLADAAVSTVQGAIGAGDARAALLVLRGLGFLPGEKRQIDSSNSDELEEQAAFKAALDRDQRSLRQLTVALAQKSDRML